MAGHDGVAGYAARSATCPSTRTAPLSLRPVGCWETEIGEDVLLALAGYPADGGRTGSTPSCARPRRLRDGTRGPRSRRPLAGLGLGGLVNILNPSLMILGGRSAGSPARPRTARGGARPPCARGVPGPRPRRAGGAGRRRAAHRGGGDRLRSDPRRSCGLVAAAPTTRFTWRAPDVDARTAPERIACRKRRLA